MRVRMRCGFQSNDFSDSNVLEYIIKSMVLVSPSVKICDFFFHCWHVGLIRAASAPCWRNEKRKRKRKDIAWTPESRKSYWFRCPTRVGHRHISKNAVLVQPRNQVKGYIKVIHCLCTCSFCVLLVFKGSSIKLNLMALLEEFLYAEMVHKFLTFSLRMIVFSFGRQRK